MAGGSRVVCVTALSVLPHAVARRGISLPRSGDPYPPMDRQRPESTAGPSPVAISERAKSPLLLQAQRAVGAGPQRKHSPVTANAEAVGEEQANATEAK